MFGVDPDIGNMALRLWVAAGSAALLVLVCALALDWTRTRTMARLSVVVLGAILGATMAWAFLAAATVGDQDADRRALEMRAADLNRQTLAPGSPLAVDGAGEPAPAPALGADTAGVLTGLLGLSAADIRALTERGIIGGPAGDSGPGQGAPDT